MIIDVHVHVKGGEDGAEILRQMDANGIDRMVLAPWYFGDAGAVNPPPDFHRVMVDATAKTAAADPERLLGFAFIEPTLPDAPEAVDYALGEKGLSGVKMMPHFWYPDDPRAQAVYARIQEFDKPILFHSGDLWTWGMTTEFCRPARYEVMMNFPKVRFAMAHMGWPWVDECLTVSYKFKSMQPNRGYAWSQYFDYTGMPRLWQREALQKAFALIGDEHVLFGTDTTPDPAAIAQAAASDREFLLELGASEEAIAGILGGNALKWLGVEG